MADSFSFYVQRYFMSYLMKQHNYGANTISSYRDTFKLLYSFLVNTDVNVSRIVIDDISHDKVIEFMTWLGETRKNGVSTKNVRLAHIKSFFRYVMMTTPEHSDQCRKVLSIPFGKEDKKPPACMSKDAIKQMLALIDSSSDEGLRHLALLSLMYDSACRVQEIVALSVKDFHAGQCCRIYVRGKGNKYRSIPLLRETEKIVSKYIKHFQLAPEAPLFSNKNGKRLTRQGIRYIIRKYSKMVNEAMPGTIEGSVYPHRMRRSRAMHLYLAGVPLPTISEWLGHSNIETTRFYAKVTEEMKRDALHKLSESEKSVFKDDVAFKYAGNEEMLKRLCGLK